MKQDQNTSQMWTEPQGCLDGGKFPVMVQLFREAEPTCLHFMSVPLSNLCLRGNSLWELSHVVHGSWEILYYNIYKLRCQRDQRWLRPSPAAPGQRRPMVELCLRPQAWTSELLKLREGQEWWPSSRIRWDSPLPHCSMMLTYNEWRWILSTHGFKCPCLRDTLTDIPRNYVLTDSSVTPDPQDWLMEWSSFTQADSTRVDLSQL